MADGRSLGQSECRETEAGDSLIMVPAMHKAGGFNPPLAAKPPLRFVSRHPDEIHAFMHGKDLRLEVPRRNVEELDVRISGFYLPAGLFIGLTEYGAPVRIKAQPQRIDYWLVLPVRGRMETTFRNCQYVGDARRACLFSDPFMGPNWNAVDANAARMTVVLSDHSLLQQLAVLLGKDPADTLHPRLEFAPILDLNRGHGRSIARLASLALKDFESGGPMTRSPLAMNSAEQFIINELLLAHPHNYSDALHGAVPSIAPRDVKRAIEFMEAHLETPVTLAEVAGAAGVPGRTLLKHFHDYRGMSPMEYLRRARFDRAHQTLRRADVSQTVSEVAVTWGFFHLGRFSAEYRRRYGELPSETLAKCHRSH
jgi:AraC-like DNA-binding protein